MPPKKRASPPIDRPLSKAYLRAFSGWANAYPPGLSDPTSLQSLANMWVNRNGALEIRPGLRYLSYASAPDMDPTNDGTLGTAFDLTPVGSQEPFYTHAGLRAMLFAVRETDRTVGFRAMLMSGSGYIVHELTDPEIGFSIPQGVETLSFSPATTHVSYLQIDNKILAMSDVGEPLRMFFVGAEKLAKRLTAVTVPQWADNEKLTVYQPAPAWIAGQGFSERINVIKNPSFENGTTYWRVSGGRGSLRVVPDNAIFGAWTMEITSTPSRTNMVHNNLSNVAGAGIGCWYPNQSRGNPGLSAGTSYMRIYDRRGKGLFLAYSSKISQGVVEGQKYQVAADVMLGPHINPLAYFTFYSANGAKIGDSVKLSVRETDGRWASSGVQAPTGAVAMRISFGGVNERSTSTFIKIKDVVVCREEEATSLFEPGADHFHWTGAPYASACVIHPPDDIYITHSDGEVRGGASCCASVYALGSSSNAYELRLEGHDRDGVELEETIVTGSISTSDWARLSVADTALNPLSVRVDMHLRIRDLARGQRVLLDGAMIEPGAGTALEYFDGSFPNVGQDTHFWVDANAPHACNSHRRTAINPKEIPSEGPKGSGTLVSSDPALNKWKMGFFYTFANELGETAPSKVTEFRVSRPWSNWLWRTVDVATGLPTDTPTEDPDRACDQLLIHLPEVVYNQAVAEGATHWHLYAFAWSDTEPVPMMAQKVNTKDIYPDEATTLRAEAASPWRIGGWMTLTPSRRVGIQDRLLPSKTDRTNYTDPPRSRSGLVAGDRMVLLGDPRAMATIKWSSNSLGDYTNFTPNVGGGEKTLTTGNIAIPAAAVLWQNPQSVDSITILCSGVDGQSNAYYMTPATVQSSSSGVITVMGFEETTSTPGSVSCWAADVMNNALYRPTGDAVVKSTAQNYTINHKNLTDMIGPSWRSLRDKHWIMSASLDNRLYYLVHNPRGEVLEPWAKGNEIWVHDISTKSPAWSRLTVQASALRPVDIGDSSFMGVSRGDGLYYFDPGLRLDDYVDEDHMVRQCPIPWSFETNTQGANRAHDAWAHLQQVIITLGSFHGTMRFGIRGKDVHGTWTDISKQVSDLRPEDEDTVEWDIQEPLLVRRDMMEWRLYGSSVEGLPSSGQVELVQYRYTPVSVNVGYEYGSIETFEYGQDSVAGPSEYSESGVPLPFSDRGRV